MCSLLSEQNRARLGRARTRLENEKLALVLIDNSDSMHVSRKRGVAPLLELVTAANPVTRDAVLADKVIGKAAALLIVFGGIRAVFAGVVSSPARGFLEKHHVFLEFETEVSGIVNREKNGSCPMEAVTLDLEDPALAPGILQQAIAGLTNSG